MVKNEIIQLLKSLSGPEKRNFKLYCKKQEGKKDYLDLFEMINKAPLGCEAEYIEAEFKNKFPNKSLESTANYLFKLTTDSLVQIRVSHDKWFQQYQSLMRSKVLFERSLTLEGYKEIKRAQKISEDLQDNLLLYHTCRLELNLWTDRNFSGIDEEGLVHAQMKAKNQLRLLYQIQEQSSLYESLKHRLLYTGRSLSDVDKAKLNDLMISEISLSTRGSKTNFESQKLHLLFQSFFFITIGDYKSSLKSFNELNNLFENNEPSWNFPPYDYLSALEGILDSLRTIKYFNEMEHFIHKIEKLADKKYPDYFQLLALQLSYIFKINVLISKDEPIMAIKLITTIPDELLQKANLVDYEKLTELLFYAGLAYFRNKNYQKANKYISILLSIGKVNNNSTICKASKLIHLIIHYELNNMVYLNYEIRSYKRTFNKGKKELKIESLIIKIIKLDPKRKSKPRNQNDWKKISKVIDEIDIDKYEKQVLKYFDFTTWIKEKYYF